MAEELQSLIERIQREAVDTGEKEAARIVAQAREKAAALVKEAEEKAGALHRKAEQEAAQFMERSERALEQAARDILITVGTGVETLLGQVVREGVDKGMTPEVIQTMLVKLVAGFGPDRDNRLEILLSEEDKTRLEGYFATALAAKLREGVELHPSSKIVKGFRVSVSGESAVHDFSREAIAESLAHFLRPRLAEIVHKVARDVSEGEGSVA
ncbi:MAG TPA: HrpE/YscL family type III secretion apparatus protein [Kiritimatiellia bacterium]|nr:HrpE/YscL family type III secretion apparatus protein [Kiritimatiellia bacterium]